MMQYDANSLREVVSITNDFERLSGLKLQMEKTCVMIFGLLPDENPIKLCPDLNLSWTSTIAFLGVTLDHRFAATDSNFDKKLTEIKAIIRDWDYRYLSPFGRKLIVQSLCLSKLANLAISLPDLSEEKIKEIERMLVDFVWQSGRKKVALKDAKVDEESGGLNLFCIKSHWSSFKIKWIHRAVTNPDLTWVRILDRQINDVIPGKSSKDIYSMTIKELTNLSKNIQSIFWKQVFKHFIVGFHAFNKTKPQNFLTVNLFDNLKFKSNGQKILTNQTNRVVKERAPFPIQYIKNTVGENFNFFSKDEIIHRHNFDGTFHLSDLLFQRIKNAISNTFQANNITGSSIPKRGPIQNAMHSFVHIQKKGASKICKIIKNDKLNTTNIEKRQTLTLDRYRIRTNTIQYKKLYKLNKTISFDNSIRFYHFLLLRDGLHTNVHRSHYAGISDMCTFCNQSREYSIHMLWDCPIVCTFRNEINNAISQNFRNLKLVPFTPKDRILGYRFNNADCIEFVFYTYVNRYIWLSKLRQTNPTLLAFKNYLKTMTDIQKKANVLTCLDNIDNLWT